MAQQQQVGEADHRGQQVVEVVRDAAGQLADRLHLLRLGELELQVLLFRGVDKVGDKAAGFSGPIRHTGHEHRADGIARASETDLERCLGSARFVLIPSGELRADRLAILFVDQVEERNSGQALGLRADKGAESAIAFGQPAARIEQRDTDRRFEEKPLEALDGALERLGHGPFARQVTHDRAGAQSSTVRARNDILADRSLEPDAVQALERDLAAQNVAAAAEGIVGRRSLGQGLGDHVVQVYRAAFEILVRQV